MKKISFGICDCELSRRCCWPRAASTLTTRTRRTPKVDIQTPLANLKVNTDEKSATDNGIPVYPGAHLRPAENGDNHAANVNIGAMGFGLKVVAAEYETDDSPEKVKAFYQDKMKTFGDVLVCSGHSGGSDVHINSKGEETTS